MPEVSNGEPLQVVTVDLKTNEVTLVEESINKLQENLKRANVEKISVVSVMGAYRTGKSFILDLFIRYLHASEHLSEDHQVAREVGPCKPPAWLAEHGSLNEMDIMLTPRKENGDKGGKLGGFNWRGGAARCTEGMWIWSEPFVRTKMITEKVSTTDDEEIVRRRKVRVGVLLMDTQGAFDSETTKQQSAALFGMTTAISSKLIYNLQGRLGTDTLEHLHYFAEMAVSAIRQGTFDGDTIPEAPFQYLEFLVRDWSNFDDETFDDPQVVEKYSVTPVKGLDRWTEKHCEAQARIHRDQHMGPDVKERNTINMLEQMFQHISVFLLPNPGLKVAESRKRKWNGDIKDIDEDFLRSVDSYCRKLFADVNVQGILGQDLSPDTFPQVFEALIDAFRGLEVSKLSMVEAIGRAKNLVAKDESSKLYKKKFYEAVKKQNGLNPDDLLHEHEQLHDEAMTAFTREATFGDIEAIEESRSELEKAIADLYEEIQKENDRILEQALSAFAGITTVGLICFVLDRASDFTCDWWSDTCVAFSKLFLMVYSCILAIVIFHAYGVMRERGKTAAGLAAIELGKHCLKCLTKGVDNIKYYSHHREELKAEVATVLSAIMNATKAVKAKDD
eukprot:GEMP01008918.1.p1 GENE.GEMP01008918.1~~GEMP01008918.1.p1  ORF type:complete len:618 (+),score=105.59 GEMP01008918.1:140-1993(+)